MSLQAGVFGEVSRRGLGKSLDDSSDLMADIANRTGEARQVIGTCEAQRSGQCEAHELVQEEFRDEL